MKKKLMHHYSSVSSLILSNMQNKSVIIVISVDEIYNEKSMAESLTVGNKLGENWDQLGQVEQFPIYAFGYKVNVGHLN